jgi:hypothetical protein
LWTSVIHIARCPVRIAFSNKGFVSSSADRALGVVLPLVSLGSDGYGPQPEIAYHHRPRAIS